MRDHCQLLTVLVLCPTSCNLGFLGEHCDIETEL